MRASRTPGSVPCGRPPTAERWVIPLLIALLLSMVACSSRGTPLTPTRIPTATQLTIAVSSPAATIGTVTPVRPASPLGTTPTPDHPRLPVTLSTPQAEVTSPRAYPAAHQSLAFTPTSDAIAVGDAAGCTIYDVPTLRERVRLSTTGGVTGIAFSRDGSLLATGLTTKQVVLWSLDQATPSQAIAQLGIPEGLVFSPDDQSLVTTSRDFGVAQYRISDGMLVRRLAPSQGGAMTSALSEDGQRLIIVDAGKPNPHTAPALTISTVRLDDGVTLGEERLLPASLVTLDGATPAIYYTRDGILWRWAFATNSWPEVIASDSQQDRLTIIVVSADGQLILGSTEQRHLLLWRVQDSALLQRNLADRRANESANQALALSPDRHWIAAVASDGTVRLWPVLSR